MDSGQFRVFVSYSTIDLQEADGLRESLSGTSVDVFVAQHSVAAGEKMTASIEEAIRCCDLCVVLWGENADASRWVKAEVGLAKGQDKFILPIVLSGDGVLPPFIEDLKYIDAREDRESAMAEAREQILARITKRTALVPEEPPVERTASVSPLVFVGVGALLFWLFSREPGSTS